MKIRSGFVSNSSSCSFLIYGVCIDYEYDLCDKIEAAYKNITGRSCYADDFKISDGGTDGSCLYVGHDYTSMKPDETRNEFERRSMEITKRVCREVGVILEDREFGVCEAAWRDG